LDKKQDLETEVIGNRECTIKDNTKIAAEVGVVMALDSK